MRKQRTPRSLSLFVVAAILALAVAFVGCDSNGADSGGTIPGAGDATLEDGDSFRAVQIGISDNSTWFQVIDSDVNGSVLDATLTRISDHNPPEGTSFALDWSVDGSSKLTFSNAQIPMSAVGRLNLTGDTYVTRDENLTDDEGSLGVGIEATTGASNATLSGTYFVGMVHSDRDKRLGYFSGYTYMVFNGAGELQITSSENDRDFTAYLDGSPYTYSVSSTGGLSIADELFPRDLIGAVRSDGELFVLAETRDETDNNRYKTIFVGVKQSAAATDALLEGTWDVCSSCSNLSSTTPIDWWEGASVMDLDAGGEGTFSDVGDSESDSIAIDLAPNGEFSVPIGEGMSMVGAITPSGDTMVHVYPQVHPTDGDYCLSIGIKTP